MEPGTDRHEWTRRRLLGLAATGVALASARPWAWPLEALAGPGRTGPLGTSMRLEAADFPPVRAATAKTAGITSRALRAPRPFQLVGVRFEDGPMPGIHVRTRRRGGAWNDWIHLPAGTDHAPDGARRRASEPAWVGASEELQIRMPAAGRAPRLYLVSSGRAATGPVARAAVAPGGGPAIIPRALWGGDLVLPRSAPSYGAVQLAFVHHTVNANDYAPQDAAAMVQAIAKYHRDANGWSDIGYNFLVDRHGQIFEGRAGGIEQAVIGAQAQGFNAVSTGIALLGTHGAQPATPAAVAALSELVGWKLARHGVPAAGAVQVVSAGGPTSRFPAGRPVVFERVAGHRDGNRTACPGDALHAQLPEIRRRAAAAAVGVPVAPPPAPVQITARVPTARITARGRGVLVRGTVQGEQGVRIAVARQVDGHWRWVRSVPARTRDGRFEVRVRLSTAGLYRLTATTGDVRAQPVLVRSIRRR